MKHLIYGFLIYYYVIHVFYLQPLAFGSVIFVFNTLKLEVF